MKNLLKIIEMKFIKERKEREEINDLLNIWQCCQFDCFWKRLRSIYKLGVDFFSVSVIWLSVALPLNVGLASGQPYLSYDVFEYSSNIGHILNDVTLLILFQESWFSLKSRINRFTSRACSTTLTKWVLNLYRSSINDVTQFLMKTSSALHYF